jgi:hypothetical protein
MVAITNLPSLIANLHDYEPDIIDLIHSFVFIPCSEGHEAGVYIKALPEPGTTVIKEDAFLNNGSLSMVIIADGVTGIDWGAFQGCSRLISISIPDSLKYIGDYAFSECAGLTSITIPDSVTHIGCKAFIECPNLMGISIHIECSYYGSAFEDHTAITFRE